MITSALINLILVPITAVLSLLPSGTPLNLNTQMQNITNTSYWPKLGWINNYIPLDQMTAAATIIIAALGITLTIRVAIYIWNLLPIGGSN
jgi:hypothetical protein